MSRSPKCVMLIGRNVFICEYEGVCQYMLINVRVTISRVRSTDVMRQSFRVSLSMTLFCKCFCLWGRERDAPGAVLVRGQARVNQIQILARYGSQAFFSLTSSCGFFTSSILDINPLFAVLILWAVKDTVPLHFWFHKTLTKTKDKYVFRSSTMYCVSYHYPLGFSS